MADFFSLAVIIGLMVLAIYWMIMQRGTHVQYGKKIILDPNASIIDIKCGLYRYRHYTPKIRTTIIFSDGFIWYTHDTHCERAGFGKQQPSVTPEMKTQFCQRAKEAHQKAVEKQH